MADTQAPSVGDRGLQVTLVTRDTISIEWQKATDNVTAPDKIRYEVFLTEDNNPADPWHLVKEATGLHSHTFTGLNPNTAYAFYVKASDEAGNSLQYPLDNGCMTAKTASAPVHKLAFSIEQGASVLHGTNTIAFVIEYNYVQLDRAGNVTGRGTGSWEYKWSNQATKSDVIELPAGCYFENNQVFVKIMSRRAASVGLNKWKTCSSGFVDVANGNLKFRLIGSYYSYNVRLGGGDVNGFAQFKDEADPESSSAPSPAPAPPHRLSFSIEQNARVLRGTDTIAFAIEYSYVPSNPAGNKKERGTSSREYKWSNQATKNDVIELPEGCCFENNQVSVKIMSRRGATIGLNKWKTCSSGFVDIADGNLKFRLVGSYYSYDVRLGGSAEEGYAQFKTE